MNKWCKVCGTEIPADAKFCHVCGNMASADDFDDEQTGLLNEDGQFIPGGQSPYVNPPAPPQSTDGPGWQQPPAPPQNMGGPGWQQPPTPPQNMGGQGWQPPPTPPQPKPKKKNVGLIIAIVVIGLLVLAGIGIAAEALLQNQGYGDDTGNGYGNYGDYGDYDDDYDYGYDDSYGDTSDEGLFEEDFSSDTELNVHTYTKGTIRNSTYVNEWANLQFDFTFGWIDDTDGDEAMAIDMAETTDCGMYAVKPVTGEYLMIAFEDLNKVGMILDEDQYIQLICNNVTSELTAEGVVPTISETYSRTIAGETYRGVDISADDSTAMEKFYCRRQGQYMIYIVALGSYPASTETMVNNITAAH